MKNVANSRFTITSWDEKPYGEGPDLPKLTRAAVTKTFTGDIAGEGHVEYLMMYAERRLGHVCRPRADRRARCRESRQLRAPAHGVFENGVAKESYVVVPGSGTGELRGLRGEGTSAVGHGTEHPLTLNYELG